MMKAAVLHAINDLRIEQVMRPELQKATDVLINVKAAGICGSDIDRIFKTGTYTFPTIPGHEFCGQVVQVGTEVTEYSEGDRVAVAPILPCYHCDYCQQGYFGQCNQYGYLGSRTNGGFAEYVVAPEANLIKLPDSVSDHHAAMIEPAAVTLHGMMRTGIRAGDHVVVLGCGPIGLFTIQFAKIMGATHITAVDIAKDKLVVAEKMGAQYLIDASKQNVEQTFRQYQPNGADIVVETAGTPITQVQSIVLAKKQGMVLYLGTAHHDVIIPPKVFERIVRDEITLTGSWNSFSAPFPGREWQAVIDYMANNTIDIDHHVTHTISLDELPSMLNTMCERKIAFNKVIIDI